MPSLPSSTPRPARLRAPPARRRAIQPLPPKQVEAIRRALLKSERKRDAALVSLLAYAGCRPGEAFALRWRNVRDKTLVIESSLSFGEEKADKARKGPRSVRLIPDVNVELAELRVALGRPGGDEPSSRIETGSP